MIEKLWNDIRLIYDGFDFSGNLLIDDLIIVSNDNYYQLYYQKDDTSTGIRIEKNHSLVNMWSDNKEADVISYKIYVENKKDSGTTQVLTSEESMIKLSYKILTPFLRQIKLQKIGV